MATHIKADLNVAGKATTAISAEPLDERLPGGWQSASSNVRDRTVAGSLNITSPI